ncbi:hypothetical protein B0T20DRAFT_505109 [Sordaria brevicollis]|uniref:Uncharacterized protein n=1 Tax=Sordaria brevicollis TaxID=83679 RepID=A0AAE0PJ32_SORBR|nr:hypothetical protein B0T20DRAFT_505109 [Sordaria brevicollis]
MADSDVPSDSDVASDSDSPSASSLSDGSETEETQIKDESDQDSVTSELSTESYAVSLKDDLTKALDKLKRLPRSAALERSNTKSLRRTLRKWLDEPNQSRQNGLYYTLDHVYDDEPSIKLSTLGGSDKVLGHVLESVCQELDFEVYIAQLEQEEIGYNEIDHSTFHDRYPASEEESEEKDYHFMDLNNPIETSYRVKTVQDMHGEPVANGLDLNLDKDILMRKGEYRDVFEDVFPEQQLKEETEGFHGNSEPPLTNWRRVHAFLLVPSTSVYQFFTGTALDLSNVTLSSLINYGVRASLRYTKVNIQRAEVLFKCTKNFCDDLWELRNERHGQRSNTIKINGDVVANILKVSLEFADQGFFETTCMKDGDVVPASFFTWAKNWLKDSEDSVFDNILETGLTSIIDRYPYFPSQLIALENFTYKHEEAGWSASLRTRVYAWVHDKRLECLKDTLENKELAGDDGNFIVHLAMKNQDPLRFLSTHVIPLLDPSRHSVAFFISLIYWLWKEGSTGSRIPVDDLKASCKTFAKQFLVSADFSKATCIGGLKLEHATTNKRQRTSSSSPSRTANPTSGQMRMTIDFADLLRFYETLAKISTAEDDEDNPVTLFITKLNDVVPRLPIDHMHYLWLPFLVHLIPDLSANAVTPLTTTAAYQSLYRSMLNRYIKNYVGKQPAQSTSLVRPRVNCRDFFCIDCPDLNAFLQSPTQRIDEWRVNKERRKHIHQMLDYHNIDCTHISHSQTTPYTLVITKTFKQQAQQLREWKGRKEFAEKKIRQFSRYPALKALLGNEYDKIVGLEDAYIESPRAAAARAAVERAAAASNNNSASTASASRHTVSATGHVRAGHRAAGAASGSSSRYNPPAVAGIRRRRSITFGDGQDIVDLTSD